MNIFKMRIGRHSFDTHEKPWRTPWYIRIIELAILVYYKVRTRFKVNKVGIKGTKPPYLILQNHASFMDFVQVGQFLLPRTSAFVCSIEQFIHREWLLRSAGCIYKRRFTSDLTVLKHILYVIRKKKKSVTIYPEARFSLAGITEDADLGTYARLIKLCKIPVILGISKGNYIMSPQFAKHPYRKLPISATFKLLFTKEETMYLSQEQIEERLRENFYHDDYKYWQDSGVRIKSKHRAKNLHKILYQCPHCKKEFAMNSKGNTLYCGACGKEWFLNEYGYLQAKEGEVYFSHVPDWYRWERENVKKQVESGEYRIETKASLEKIASSAKGLKHLGKVDLVHDQNGFTVKGILDNGKEFYFNRSAQSMTGCHIEFNFHKKGDAIDLSDSHQTFFLFPYLFNHVTKIHFATEELYKKNLREKEKENLSK